MAAPPARSSCAAPPAASGSTAYFSSPKLDVAEAPARPSKKDLMVALPSLRCSPNREALAVFLSTFSASD